VVELPNAASTAEPETENVSAPGKLHAAGIAGMAISAVVGIVALLARITVGWPGGSDRYVTAVFVFAVVAFLASASIAVFSAARNTYPSRLGPEKEK
jgi:high-affinity Fe2+/Pb2+ permease